MIEIIVTRTVRVSGVKVGRIVSNFGGFAFKPVGNGGQGPTFKTLEECIDSVCKGQKPTIYGEN